MQRIQLVFVFGRQSQAKDKFGFLLNLIDINHQEMEGGNASSQVVHCHHHAVCIGDIKCAIRISDLGLVLGTTLGMLIADVPAVFVGDRFSKKIPMKIVHSIAAAMFAAMGILALLKVDAWIK